ncbi:hypothetical protein HYV84_01815 [Candidatus Woesearchaeota archaeon]|nr:hypothetical protein [Candidatus Woesearchaeota archaeon]
MEFVHRITKGGRFNQIYIPKEAEHDFEAGDLVQVKLLQKRAGVYYSSKKIKLTPFKEKLARDVFSLLLQNPSVKMVFFVGSFLTSHSEYRDIDIAVIGADSQHEIQAAIPKQLSDAFGLRFHILFFTEEQLPNLLRVCPLTRGMFSLFASSMPFSLPTETLRDEKHIEFLIMMPEDLLSVAASPRAFYDALRRVIAIEHFLLGRPLDGASIGKETGKLMGDQVATFLADNESLPELHIAAVRKVIREKIASIRTILGHGKTKNNR